MSIIYSLSSELKYAIELAKNQARQYSHATYGGGHLLYGLLDEDANLHETFHQLNKEVPRLRRWAEFRIEHYSKSTKQVEEPTEDNAIQQLLKEADRIRLKDNSLCIEPIHALETLCMPNVAFTEEQLRKFPILPEEIASVCNRKVQAKRNGSASTSKEIDSGRINNKTLSKFCENISQMAQNGKIDPVIGREKELQDVITILGKRVSPNVILVGEPGVGKTALIGGLAHAIAEKQVPESLHNTTILELDVHGKLVAGAYKGEVEARLKSVLQALKQKKDVILFIDEIHSLLDDQTSVGGGAINLLKPETARGEITIIGATTNAEYKKYFEKDPAFSRRFSKLELEEPSAELAMQMIQGLVPHFEEHHKVQIDGQAIPEAVMLAKRYFTQKRLPASAIELLDITCSSTRMMIDTSLCLIDKFIDKTENFDSLVKKNELIDFFRVIKSSISFLLLKRLPNSPELDFDNPDTTIIDQIKNMLKAVRMLAMERYDLIQCDDVIITASHQTKIPLGKIQTNEAEKYKDLSSLLKTNVIGQDHAIEKVASVFKRSRVFDSGNNKPSGIFFFAGPTGTGKTELAKTIASVLFNDENALIQFDMSEYMEKHAAETLVGAPPGYVGYEEGGRLVNSIRQAPYSVLLFDEIEKAHTDVYKLFLQILGGAKLTDRHGKKGDFSNSIIIFTSNVCSDWIREAFENEDPPTSHKDQEMLKDKMKSLRDSHGQEIFLPEFLGRIPNIIPFAPISKDVALIILDMHISKFQNMLSKQNIEIEVSEQTKNQLIEQGFSPNYGARPLEYIIEEMLGSTVAEKILSGEITAGSTMLVDIGEDNNYIWINQEK